MRHGPPETFHLVAAMDSMAIRHEKDRVRHGSVVPLFAVPNLIHGRGSVSPRGRRIAWPAGRYAPVVFLRPLDKHRHLLCGLVDGDENTGALEYLLRIWAWPRPARWAKSNPNTHWLLRSNACSPCRSLPSLAAGSRYQRTHLLSNSNACLPYRNPPWLGAGCRCRPQPQLKTEASPPSNSAPHTHWLLRSNACSPCRIPIWSAVGLGHQPQTSPSRRVIRLPTQRSKLMLSSPPPMNALKHQA